MYQLCGTENGCHLTDQRVCFTTLYWLCTWQLIGADGVWLRIPANATRARYQCLQHYVAGVRSCFVVLQIRNWTWYATCSDFCVLHNAQLGVVLCLMVGSLVTPAGWARFVVHLC
jgi:hypothetical protein